MRRYHETEMVEMVRTDTSHPCAAIRSYQAIAAILTDRYGRQVTETSVGKRCTAAERRLAAGLRSDPLIQRWLRRQRIELASDRNGTSCG